MARLDRLPFKGLRERQARRRGPGGNAVCTEDVEVPEPARGSPKGQPSQVVREGKCHGRPRVPPRQDAMAGRRRCQACDEARPCDLLRKPSVRGSLSHLKRPTLLHYPRAGWSWRQSSSSSVTPDLGPSNLLELVTVFGDRKPYLPNRPYRRARGGRPNIGPGASSLELREPDQPRDAGSALYSTLDPEPTSSFPSSLEASEGNAGSSRCSWTG